MLRIIITGGSGLIGRRLSRLLHRDDYEVIVLSRNPKQYDLDAGVHVHQWDAKTSAGWGHLVRSDTVIINLAGENPAQLWTDKAKTAILQSRLQATQAVVQAIQESPHKPQALLQASAVGYYADHGDNIITEETPLGDDWLAEVCHQWEAAAQPAIDSGVRTCFLRIGIVLDPQGGALPSFIQAANMMSNRFGDGEQWIPWVHHDDVSHMLRYLMLKERASGIYNICSPQPATNQTLLQTLADIKKRPSWLPIPQKMLDLVMGEMATTVLHSQRVIPQRIQQEGYNFRHEELKHTLENLLHTT